VTAFRSDPADVTTYSNRWLDIPGKRLITAMPLWDREASLFARMGWGVAEKWLAAKGWCLPTVEDYDALHAAALHIDPYTLPTEEMRRKAGIPPQTAAIDRYRNANMMTRSWCALHDCEVFRRLSAAGWLGGPVANCGKHLGAKGVIVGWWHADGSRIQNPSYFHRGDPTYCDYATNAHAVRDACEEPLP